MINNELYHFGVKGMHWGIRRYQQYSSSNGVRVNRSIAKKNAKASYHNLVKLKKLKDAGKAENYEEDHDKALNELSKATQVLGQKKINQVLRAESFNSC